MHSNLKILFFLIFGAIVLGFNTSAASALSPKATAAQEEIKIQKTADGAPLSQEQQIVLDPFFFLRKNGSRVWVERIIITLVMGEAKNFRKHGLNIPTFRKIIYSLLQSGEHETNIKAQAVDSLNYHLGQKTNAKVQISHSVLIVR